MKTNSLFEPTEAQIDLLIARFPFALLISTGPDGLAATPLPFLFERHSDGRQTLLGHLSRANPQVRELGDNPDALVAFQGPHGYISPSWFSDRSQAPTWNFASVHFSVRVELLWSHEENAKAVEILTHIMEAGRPSPWNPTELGSRYARLLPSIVAFKAHVVHTVAKFKLGQNERTDVLKDAIAGLDREPLPDLAAMMRSANSQKLSDEAAGIEARSLST